MNTYNCDVRPHSRHHLELKSEYPLLNATDRKKRKFEMDFYFFFPAQLQISGKRIGVKGVLGSLKTYTRFSTPALSLEKLIDPSCSLSPLIRIREMIGYSELEKPGKMDSLVYEIQMLVNMYRVEIKGVSDLLREEVRKHAAGGTGWTRMECFLEEIASFLEAFRSLHASFLNPHITDVHRKALRWADESLSIITQQGVVDLYPFCHRLGPENPFFGRIEKLAEKERAYRKEMDFKYLYEEDDPFSGERMAYRDSMLKKWSQAALYMNSEDSRTPRRVGHILAGAAAGVAMIFAVTISIFADRVFLKNSTSWALLIVISYIFKDRIKEILRDVFGRFLPQLTADQQIILNDPATGKRVGDSKGTLRFGKASEVSDHIFKERYRRPNPFRDILPEQNLLHFSRTITIRSRKLKANHTRLRGITEIIRFHIEDWLREMDDSKDLLYRIENGKRIKIKGKRVYHIHLIVSLREKERNDSDALYHYLIVLNKEGILRIEILDERV